MGERQIYLTFIQQTIECMRRNSFFLKGWSVTLISAIFVLATTKSDSRYIIIAFLPAITFWILDSYYLYQERLFRELHKAVIKQKNNEDFLSLDISDFKDEIKWHKAVSSLTISIFHGCIIGMIGVVMFILLIF